jgi:hypothetical protein
MYNSMTDREGLVWQPLRDGHIQIATPQEADMNPLRLMLTAVLAVLPTLAVAQSAQSGAQKPFDSLKSLAGTWEGPVTTTPKMSDMGDMANVVITMRVTSRGNAIVHEMSAAGKFDDTANNDHPVTMFYLKGDSLMLVHYCDAGNRPRMTARTSPDGKTIDFDFVDLEGSTEHGHMQHATFTFIDATHHTEDWTYLMPGDKPVRAHADLHRAQTTVAER